MAQSDVESANGNTSEKVSEINQDGSSTESFKTPKSTSELFSPTTFPTSKFSIDDRVIKEILEHREQIMNLDDKQPGKYSTNLLSIRNY